jgi:hypothetical protein
MKTLSAESNPRPPQTIPNPSSRQHTSISYAPLVPSLNLIIPDTYKYQWNKDGV